MEIGWPANLTDLLKKEGLRVGAHRGGCMEQVMESKRTSGRAGGVCVWGGVIPGSRTSPGVSVTYHCC